MDLSKFTRDELIMGSVALLLVIDLLFLPWFEVSVGIGSAHCRPRARPRARPTDGSA